MFNLKGLLVLATAIAEESKANTKVGCVIYDKNNKTITSGYNQFFKGLEETEDHWDGKFTTTECVRGFDKHKFIIHAEVAALFEFLRKYDLFATDHDAVLVCTMKPCSNCMRLIAHAGIKKVFYKNDNASLLTQEDIHHTEFICYKAGITCQKI